MSITFPSITIPSQLSDGALIAEVTRCARDERHATARLIAHLAELDARGLYRGAGHATLFAYCHHGLGLSEDAAYSRVEAARVCRLFPLALEQLVDGSLTVTSVRLLARHLTAENHRDLLAAASRRSKREVQELIACRFPTQGHAVVGAEGSRADAVTRTGRIHATASGAGAGPGTTIHDDRGTRARRDPDRSRLSAPGRFEPSTGREASRRRPLRDPVHREHRDARQAEGRAGPPAARHSER